MWRASGALLGAGLIASVLWTWATRDSLSLAATRLDQAAGLKERLSTALAVAASSDPFAKAVVADATHVSHLVTPKMYLPVRVPSSAPYAGGAFLMALMFFWLFPAVDLSGRQAARAEDTQKQNEVQKVQAQVRPVVDKLRQIQEKHPEIKKDSPEADPLQTAKLDTPMDYKRQALKEVNAVAAKLDQKKGDPSLGKVEELKTMLRHLAAQPTPPTIVGALSKSLAKGDFKSAQAALDSIRQELNKEPQSAEDKARADQLRADLKKVSDQLGKISDSNNKLKDQLQQLNLSQEEMNKLLDKLAKGDMNEVSKHLADKGITKDQIDKVMKQAAKSAEARKALSQFAQNLAKAAAKDGKNPGEKGKQAAGGKKPQQGQGQKGEQGKQGQQGKGQQGEQGQGQGEGDMDNTAEGFQQADEQLSEMESLQQQMSDLNTASAELKELKEQLGGSNEGGEGDPDQRGMGMGHLGIGEGGVAKKQETAFATTPQRTAVHTMSGAIIDQKFVQGEQYKGEVTNEFVEAQLGAREDLTDVNRLKTQPRHIKLRQAEYFKHIDSDLPKEKVEAAKKKIEAQQPPAAPAATPAK